MMGRVLSSVLMVRGSLSSSRLTFLQLLQLSMSACAAPVLFHSISVLAVVGGMNGD